MIFRRVWTVIITLFRPVHQTRLCRPRSEVPKKIWEFREKSQFVLTVGATANQNGTALTKASPSCFGADFRAGFDDFPAIDGRYWRFSAASDGGRSVGFRSVYLGIWR